MLGLQTATFSLCPHVTSPLCGSIPGVLVLSDKDMSPIRLRLTLVTSLTFSEYSHFGD